MKMHSSGQYDTYRGGAVRDCRDGKGRYDLINPYVMGRLAKWFELGGKGKGDRNWEEGISLSRFWDSACRHWYQVMAREHSEDHPIAAMWNIHGYIATEWWIKQGILPPELDDMPRYNILEKNND